MVRGMNGLKKGWFSELSSLWPGISQSLEVSEVLHSEKSDFQDILVLQTKNHGRALVLDGIIQCTEFDEFAYQEMIAFLPLCSHPNPKKVLIVGGGDGGVAREVAKHPAVETIFQVEIDCRVIEVSKKFLPFMSVGYSSPKLSLFVEDGFKFMMQHKEEFDVIITDSSDPGLRGVIISAKLFQIDEGCPKAGGVVCSQAGTVWANLEHVAQTLEHCRSVFNVAAFAHVAVPTYPSGQIGFVLGSLNSETNFKEPTWKCKDEDLKVRYYSSNIHRSAFVLPRFVEEVFRCNKTTSINNKHK